MSSDTQMYDIIASDYDSFNENLDYTRWADYMEECFRKFRPDGVKSVLDLGCGTGKMTLELRRRGYDMIGLDLSENMLSVADSVAREEGYGDVLFIRGDMVLFELYGTVDSIICTLDGINHITSREDLYSCFHCVANYLNPCGLFIFDLNTPHKFETVYRDRDYVLDDDKIMCTWRSRVNKKGDLAHFYITVFEEQDDGSWDRVDTVESERAYGIRAIKKALEDAGLELVSLSGGYDFEKPDRCAERWYITAKKK